jgi:hypothetical protein
MSYLSNYLKVFLFVVIALSCSSFSGKKSKVEFEYPGVKDARFSMFTDKFRKFKKEWRGEDYYYISEKGRGDMICSVLFYRLNPDEVKDLIDAPRQQLGLPAASPAYPLSYFSSHSPTMKYESGNERWGKPDDDFMFNQNDIKEFDGIAVNQKNMHAYAMFGNNLFVNVHISKINCTKEDSTVMREVLASLKK